MGCAVKKTADCLIGICRTINMSLPSQRGIAELKLVERRRREITDVFPYDRKCAPQGIGLESHNDPCARVAADAAYKLQIASQAVFIYKGK